MPSYSNINERNYMWNDITDFVNQYSTALSLRIVNLKQNIIDYLYSSGKNLITQNRLSEALDKFERLLDYTNSDYQDVKNIIPNLQWQIRYEKGIRRYSKTTSSYYRYFFWMAYPNNYKDSKEIFEKSFAEYYSNEIQKAKKDNSLDKYEAVFDTLEQYGNDDRKINRQSKECVDAGV